MVKITITKFVIDRSLIILLISLSLMVKLEATLNNTKTEIGLEQKRCSFVWFRDL